MKNRKQKITEILKQKKINSWTVGPDTSQSNRHQPTYLKVFMTGVAIESESRPASVQPKREAKLWIVIGLTTMHAVCRIKFMLFPIFIYGRIMLRNWVLKLLQAYIFLNLYTKKVREKSRECHNYKPQPLPDTKTKRKRTKPNSANQTNVRKALSPSSEVIAMLKGLKKHKRK